MRLNRSVKSLGFRRGTMMAGLVMLLPAMMGGCPEFQNNLVNIANEATQSIVLGDTDPNIALESATRGVLSAAFDLLFDQLRDDSL